MSDPKMGAPRRKLHGAGAGSSGYTNTSTLDMGDMVEAGLRALNKPAPVTNGDDETPINPLDRMKPTTARGLVQFFKDNPELDFIEMPNTKRIERYAALTWVDPDAAPKPEPDEDKTDEILQFIRRLGIDLVPWQETFLRAWLAEVQKPPVQGAGIMAEFERARRRSSMLPPGSRPVITRNRNTPRQ